MSTKDIVLEILNQNIDCPTSGEILAQKCNVSRAAVWKAVKTLREQGYKIEGTTNGGYILLGNKDVFSKDAILTTLSKSYPQYSNSYIETFSQIDSTNTYAKQLISKTADITKIRNGIITAETQTAGRGRLGRTFVSPTKTGVYLSIIYAPETGITEPALLTAFSAVAICRVLKKLYKVEPKIKWINDIFVNGKKIAGILTEGTANFETGLIDSAIIGIGINILDNPEILNPEISKIAGSILGNSEQEINRCELIGEIWGQTLSIFEENPMDLIKEYKEYSFLIGKTIQVHPIIGDDKSVYNATAIDINEKAGLIVKLEDGSTKILNSGEVSLHSN